MNEEEQHDESTSQPYKALVQPKVVLCECSLVMNTVLLNELPFLSRENESNHLFIHAVLIHLYVPTEVSMFLTLYKWDIVYLL